MQMANTVNSAFSEFMKDYVNLDSTQVSRARASRTWLVEQISKFPNKHTDFPSLYEEKHLGFGSFVRSTKKRRLDDIDHLICMNAKGVSYTDYFGTVYMTVPDDAHPFTGLKHSDSNYLNSIKVVNRFVKYLNEIPQYEKADIKRNQEAVTLNLVSYDWNFDIVPCFFTTAESDNRTYYLIPDGNGHWKKTDNRIDQARVSTINQNNDGHVVKVIRAMKYWNKRPTMTTMGSYLLENMILNYYEFNKATQWIDLEVRNILLHVQNSIYGAVYDPKGIQGDINTLNIDERHSIFNRAYLDYNKAQEAVAHETSDASYAISRWSSIFGDNFPDYTG
jgi:hypothetical protein